MRRFLLPLWLCVLSAWLAGPVHAQVIGVPGSGAPGSGSLGSGPRGSGQEPGAEVVFDADLLGKVQAEAIAFMLPRALEAVSAEQLAMWGVNGLTTLDPALTTTLSDGRVRLLARGRVLLEAAAPGNVPAAWGALVTRLAVAGYAASPALRRAGQAGVTKALFDGTLAHLDPYSRYIPPMEALSDRDRRVGHAGIGVTLAPRGRSAVVRDVIIGSPGALAGIAPGDVIEWVDGRTALNRDPATIEAMLSGPEGTELRMGWIGRDGRARGATLTRIMTPPETVFPRRAGDIIVLQITGFSQTTAQHVAQVVREGVRAARPVAGIILDLRGNRGGLLRAAVATADAFLEAGVVVQSAGRAPEANRVWLSANGEEARGVRLVVLVDGGTASAAEVLAAALADRGRAVVVGTSTFGKGVVQTIEALPDGGELFLTWSRLLAPRGWPIQSLGVLPQLCTSLGEEAVRRQFATLAGGRNEMEAALLAHRAARAPVTPDQIVAIRERCPAADSRDTDLAVAQALIAAPASHAAALLRTVP